MCYIGKLIQIIECKKLEVRSICFEIKCKCKVDSNSINYISNWFILSAEDETSKRSHYKLSLQPNWILTSR
jgi:hypothetical protein